MSCFGLSLHCSKTRWISSTCPTYSSFDQRWPFPILKQLRTHLPVDFKTIPSILQSRLRSEVLLFFLTKGNVLLPIFWIGFHYSNLLLFQRVNPSTSPVWIKMANTKLCHSSKHGSTIFTIWIWSGILGSRLGLNWSFCPLLF